MREAPLAALATIRHALELMLGGDASIYPLSISRTFIHLKIDKQKSKAEQY